MLTLGNASEGQLGRIGTRGRDLEAKMLQPLPVTFFNIKGQWYLILQLCLLLGMILHLTQHCMGIPHWLWGLCHAILWFRFLVPGNRLPLLWVKTLVGSYSALVWNFLHTSWVQKDHQNQPPTCRRPIWIFWYRDPCGKAYQNNAPSKYCGWSGQQHNNHYRQCINWLELQCWGPFLNTKLV